MQFFILAWNAQGLGSPGAFDDLRCLTNDAKPDLLFVSESRFFSHQCSNWKFILGFEGQFVVNCNGRK